MNIVSLYIDNFRGFNDFTVSDFAQNTLIIGKNDSGKTNLCMAIRKILDLDVRRVPFDEADSTNSNKKDITIRMILSIKGIEKENRSLLGEIVDRDETITIELSARFNEETLLYEETVSFGSIDKKEYATNKATPIDKVIDLIYVNPNYNLFQDKNDFFKFRNAEDRENEQLISSNVSDAVDHLNQVISEEDVVKGINASLNDGKPFQDFFGGMKFRTESNINPTNIYRSLDIVPYDRQNAKYNNIGDGKNKTLSLLLKNISRKSGKEKILIVEEPENHLYPQYQRQFSSLIDSLQPDQMIITTHSPSIVDFRKMGRIIKLFRNDQGEFLKTLNIGSQDDFAKYGFLANEDFAQMLFYDEVLLVEGFSERYFYNRLMIEDNSFRDYCSGHNLGVFAVGGLSFKPYRELLGKLGIKVLIKTDNDVFCVPHTDKKIRQYAGLKRVVECLDEEALSNFLNVLHWSGSDDAHFQTRPLEKEVKEIEDQSDQIQSFFKKQGIFLSKHHEGFEKDFLDFVGMDSEDNRDYLCEAKLRNLHSFIQERNIKLTITDANKRSILVDFMNV